MKYTTLLALGTLAAAGTAHAGFEVISPTTASQEVEMELVNTVKIGGVPVGSTLSEHEIGVSYGALEFFQIGLSFEIENERGDSATSSGFEAFTKLAILGGETQPGQQLIDMAIYTELGFSFESNNDRTLTVGPTVGVNFDPFTVTTNGFFVVPLANSNANTGFEYAFGAMFDLNDSVALGFEAHGEVPSIIDGAPALGTQEHFAGPAVAFSFEPEEDREVGLRLGSFFGLTNAAADMAVSANLELGF